MLASRILAVLVVASLGCDGATVTPAEPQYWCHGEPVTQHDLASLEPGARKLYLSTCSTEPPPEPSPPPSLVAPDIPKVPPTLELADGSLQVRGYVDYFGTRVVIDFTVDAATRADPGYLAARAETLSASTAFDEADPTDPERGSKFAARISAEARQRRELIRLGDLDAALGMAIMILGELTQHLEYASLVSPSETSLVATFHDAGTGYCNALTAHISDEVRAVQRYSDCWTEEYNHFVIVETIASQGRWPDTTRCVGLAQAVGGSYKRLAECLRDEYKAKNP